MPLPRAGRIVAAAKVVLGVTAGNFASLVQITPGADTVTIGADMITLLGVAAANADQDDFLVRRRTNGAASAPRPLFQRRFTSPRRSPSGAHQHILLRRASRRCRPLVLVDQKTAAV